MKILGIEFSSPQRSIAVAMPEAPKSPAHTPHVAVAEVLETGGRASHAFAMTEECLTQAGLTPGQIECVAVGLGPGSYTGIRAAIALAQGWQLASSVKLVGLSSAECLAAAAAAEGFSGVLGVVIDAQRNEFYLAGYEVQNGRWNETQALRLASLDHVRDFEASGALLAGPEVQRWFPEGRILFPRAASLCELARKRDSATAGEKLEPIYLRETAFVKAPPRRCL